MAEQSTQSSTEPRNQFYAAIDLGSNSFHMVVVHVVSGNVQIVNKIKQKVRLAAGLSEEMQLDQASMQRGLDCLATFAERLQDIPISNVRIVATATLRLAANAHDFIEQAEQILRHKVNVISGEEEARQIYLGVAYTSANQGNMLVIDIGGASTEIVIGNDMQPIHLVSLNIGCVTLMDNCFTNGEISQANFARAKEYASRMINEVKDAFLCFDWQHCLGASGTPQAVMDALFAKGVSDTIKLDFLNTLEQECIAAGHVDKLAIAGLHESRKAIFPSGLAILISLFNCLSIRDMNIASGALREGLIYGMLDSLTESDRQQQTLNLTISRYHIDKAQSQYVTATAIALGDQFCAQTNVDLVDAQAILGAAATLHEIGMHIEYKKYHEHGAYILEHIDMTGFNRLQRAAIRDLVRQHRMSIDVDVFSSYHADAKPTLLGLMRILRLAVVLCIRRHNKSIPELALQIDGDNWSLTFPENWLKDHPLIKAELMNEAWLQHRVGWTLTIN